MSDLFETLDKPRRPVLRYHGGKWRIASWIISHFPEHRIYVEPFCGAASVLMKKQRSFAEVINDLDDDVVNVFRILRDPDAARRLSELLELTPWARSEFFNAYEPSADAIEQARRTIVRSFMGFGSTGKLRNGTGFRGKAERENSTGTKDWQNYPLAVRSFVGRMKGVVIENRPAIDLIKNQDGVDTLFYLDPPYPHSTRSAIRGDADFGRCYAVEMHDSDHRRLGELLRLVKGMVVISGYHCELYQELFGDWTVVEKDTRADGGKKRTEVLWMNSAAASRLQSPKTKDQ